jgi:hypothetical protein
MKETKATTVKEILIAARWIIDNVGWCHKGGSTSKAGKHTSLCALLAIDEVDHIPSITARDAHNVLRAIIFKDNPINLPFTYVSISEWNDYHSRTKEQVLDLYDRAIASLP